MAQPRHRILRDSATHLDFVPGIGLIIEPLSSLPDEVILLDPHGRHIGTAPRATVHGPDTPLHLAFSVYLTDEQGRFLATRRALTKRTWPGVWTNSFCGHVRPGEEFAESIRRHAYGELGITVRDVEVILPEFRYRAVDASGIVENEICPVFRAVTSDEITPNPDELAQHVWLAPGEFAATAQRSPWALSPWSVAQVAELERAGVSV